MLMLNDRTEAAQGSIRTGPRFEPRLDGRCHVFKLRKVLIVQAAAPDQLPDTLDWVEFGAVGGQKVQTKVICDFLPPSRMQLGMVIAGIVYDDDDLTPGSAAEPFEFAQEIPAGARIEAAFGVRHHQPAVFEANRAKEADAFAGRSMHAERIVHFGRHPQCGSASRAAESAPHPWPRDRRRRFKPGAGVFLCALWS
jgi:hypothetical protein